MHPEALWRTTLRRACGPGVALVVALSAASFWPGPVRAEDVGPLEVPRGAGPAPERHADQGVVERIEKGAEAQLERGFSERPIQAWALLAEGRRSGDRRLVERALAVAPNTPGVRLAAAAQGVLGERPLDLIWAFGRSFPALIWLLTVVATSLGVAVWIATLVVVLIGLTRTLRLHGHALGHALPLREPAAGPGAVLAIGLLAALPLLGLGAGLVLAVGGALAAWRLSAPLAWTTGVLLALSGVALGPGLDGVSRLVTQPVASPTVAAAWRFDAGQPLPDDLVRLEAAAKAAPDDGLLVYSLANALKHHGELARAESLIASRPAPASALLEARSMNLHAILRLAQGDVDGALGHFERARAMDESATVLYNLSQAYARNVDLGRRQELYSAAQQLDSERVSRYASFEGVNVHQYVIQEPLPVPFYLERAFQDSRDARALAHELRALLLGSGAPA